MTAIQWFDYTGDYEKVFYDIKLKDGTIIEGCWPNAGNFHDKVGNNYFGETVTQLRWAPNHWKPQATSTYPRMVIKKKVKKNGKRR